MKELKLYEIKHGNGEKEWVAAFTIVSAICCLCYVTGMGLHDIEDSEVIEIPKENWKNYQVENDYGEPIETFKEAISKISNPDVIATTSK